MSPSSAADESQTWAVRPISQASDEPLPPLSDLAPGVCGHHQQTPSPFGGLSKEYHSGSTGSDSDTLKPSRTRRSNTVSSVGYKPTLSKPTFQWIKGELLGKGSYGQVYLALNATTGDLMAVKQVELPKTASDRANTHQLNVLKALKFESDTLKDLDHPNIVQYLGFEENHDYLSIFLEYVPGGSVSAVLQAHGRLREEVVTSFLYQILCGLEFLHSKSIIHRDLKADNILVQTTGVCKISDFGISKKASDLAQGGRAHTMMRGTVYWMAPEVVSSNGQGYDNKVDIWGVGCIALEMWTGRRPWSDLPMMPVMFKLFTEKSPPPVPADVQISTLADAFRSECFHVDPQKRPHAHILKKHAYLHLYKKSEWMFDIKKLAYSDKPPPPPPLQYSSQSQAGQTWSARTVTATGEAPTVVPSRSSSRHPSSKPSLTALKIPEYRPPRTTSKRELSRRPSGSDRTHRTASPPAPKQDGDGPRVVYITPPGSPKSRATDNMWGLSSSLSSASEAPSTRRGKSRRYVINNPDEGSHTPSFIYTPPPLPDANPTPSATSPSFKTSRPPEPETPPQYTSSFIIPETSPPPHSSIPSPIRSAGSEPSPSPVPSSASTSMLRSPRQPPPSPAAPIPMPSTSISFKSAYPPPRFPPATPSSLPLSSSSRREDMRNTAYRAAHSQDHSHTATVNGKAVRRLPISPPRGLKTSTSIAHLPSRGSRSLMKQKSVPDVSIFAYDRPNTAHGSTVGTHNISSFSLDSDPDRPSASEQYDARRPSTASKVTPGRALPDPMKFARRSGSVEGDGPSIQKHERRLTLRPCPEDVYEHLESWFPNHNLDQSLDDDSTADTPAVHTPHTADGQVPRERKRDNRKSIRMIVKEQVELNRCDGWTRARRQTRLWNSYVKELKG